MLRKTGKIARQARKALERQQSMRVGNMYSRSITKGAGSGNTEFLASMKTGWTNNHNYNAYPKSMFMKSHNGHLRPKQVI